MSQNWRKTWTFVLKKLCAGSLSKAMKAFTPFLASLYLLSFSLLRMLSYTVLLYFSYTVLLIISAPTQDNLTGSTFAAEFYRYRA